MRDLPAAYGQIYERQESLQMIAGFDVNIEII